MTKCIRIARAADPDGREISPTYAEENNAEISYRKITAVLCSTGYVDKKKDMMVSHR